METSPSINRVGLICLAEASEKATRRGQYDFEELLGSGAFGSVFLARDTCNKERVAIKICCTGRSTLRDSHLKEAKALWKLRSAHVVGMKYAYRFDAGEEKGKAISIVMEYYEQGNLNDFLVANPELETRQRMNFMFHLACGLEHIHLKGYTHRDIKPENLLIDGEFNLKIADLGLAKASYDIAPQWFGSGVSFGDYMVSYAGTAVFMAPEVSKKSYSSRADIFSAGLVFVSIWCPRRFQRKRKILPFVPSSSSLTLGEVLRQEVSSQDGDTHSGCAHLGIRSQLPQPLRALVNGMLHSQYKARPAASKVARTLGNIKQDPLCLAVRAVVRTSQASPIRSRTMPTKSPGGGGDVSQEPVATASSGGEPRELSLFVNSEISPVSSTERMSRQQQPAAKSRVLSDDQRAPTGSESVLRSSPRRNAQRARSRLISSDSSTQSTTRQARLAASHPY